MANENEKVSGATLTDSGVFILMTAGFIVGGLVSTTVTLLACKAGGAWAPVEQVASNDDDDGHIKLDAESKPEPRSSPYPDGRMEHLRLRVRELEQKEREVATIRGLGQVKVDELNDEQMFVREWIMTYLRASKDLDELRGKLEQHMQRNEHKKLSICVDTGAMDPDRKVVTTTLEQR
jgi:hypothetical protein